jgi:hypothetical protein
VAEVLDLACRLTFSAGLSLYGRLAAWVILPVFAGLLALHYAAGVAWGWIWVLSFLAAVFVEAPFTIAASRLMFGEAPTVRQVLSLWGKRLGGYLWAMLLKALYLTLAAAAFVLPLLSVRPNGVFVTEASVLEQAGAGEAWSRSKRLVLGRSSEAMAALFAWDIARISFVGAAELLFQGVVDDILQLGRPFGALFDDGVTPYALVGLLLSTPFVATARFLQYIDTRTRGDGWDIQVKFMAIMARNDERSARPEAA